MPQVFQEVTEQCSVLDKKAIFRLLETNEYGFLSLEMEEELVPVIYVYDEDYLYLQSAKIGQTLDSVYNNRKVFFSLPEDVDLNPKTEYLNVIIRGTACVSTSEQEKKEIMSRITKKYCIVSPTEDLDQTTIIKIVVDHI